MPAERLPRVLFVGRGRYSLPLPHSQARKWHALEQVIDYRVLGAAEPGSGGSTERFRLSAPDTPGAAQRSALPGPSPRSHRASDP